MFFEHVRNERLISEFFGGWIPIFFRNEIRDGQQVETPVARCRDETSEVRMFLVDPKGVLKGLKNFIAIPRI